MGIVRRSYMLVISGSQRVKLNIMGLLEVEREDQVKIIMF